MSSRGISYLLDTSVSLRSEAFRVCELKKSGFASRVKPPRKPKTHRKTQDDPHKLRRLRRPTGPRRAAMY